MVQCAQLLSHVQLFVTSWTVALQALLSVGLSRQEYWTGLSFPPLEDLPDPGIEPATLVSPALAGQFFTAMPPGKPQKWKCYSVMSNSLWTFLCSLQSQVYNHISHLAQSCCWHWLFPLALLRPWILTCLTSYLLDSVERIPLLSFSHRHFLWPTSLSSILHILSCFVSSYHCLELSSQCITRLLSSIFSTGTKFHDDRDLDHLIHHFDSLLGTL